MIKLLMLCCLSVCLSVGDVYWSDSKRHSISHSHCLKSSPRCVSEDIVTDLVHTVEGVAIDGLSQVLYWTDAGRRLIEAMKLPSGPRTVLVWQDVDSPRGITVHYDSG